MMRCMLSCSSLVAMAVYIISIIYFTDTFPIQYIGSCAPQTEESVGIPQSSMETANSIESSAQVLPGKCTQ